MQYLQVHCSLKLELECQRRFFWIRVRLCRTLPAKYEPGRSCDDQSSELKLLHSVSYSVEKYSLDYPAPATPKAFDLRSSKLCVAVTFAGVLFLYCLFSVFFKLRWTTNNRLKKTTRELFDAILFSLCRLVSNCSSIVLPIIFLDTNQIWDNFWCLLQKKKSVAKWNHRCLKESKYDGTLEKGFLDILHCRRACKFYL